MSLGHGFDFNDVSDEELKKGIREEILKPVKLMLGAMAEDDEFFTIIATLTKKSYDALIAVGMPTEVAAQVASNQAAGMMKGNGK